MAVQSARISEYGVHQRLQLPSIRKVLAGSALLVAALAPQVVSAATLKVATWNLGWHVSQAEVGPWIAQCGKAYSKNPESGVWEVVTPQPPGARVGSQTGCGW